MNKLIFMVETMLKIGFIGFGGGTALIPVIEDEVVEKSGIVTEEEFNSDVMIASITPGALPVEIATGIGKETAGNKGMIAAATAMAFPGAFLTILFLVIFSSVGDMVKTQITYLAVGISAFIILTLLLYSWGTLQQAKNKNEKALYFCIILAVFVLSGEKNIYQLLGLSLTPIFAISTLQVLGLAFFVILFTKGQLRTKRRTIPALVIAACYVLCAGNAHIIPEKAEPFLLGLMVLLAIVGTVQSVAESPHKKAFPVKDLTGSLICWILFTLILSIPALYLSIEILGFIGTGFLSSVMSFGGGDAYLSVAQGLFVDSGTISYHDFYGNIVSVANALPGSILCKILSGVGYVIGYNLSGSALEGICVALCGFACSVAASGAIVVAVRAVYEKYENLRIFAVVKHFIRPIISGLLLNVAVSLYSSGIGTQAPKAWPTGLMFALALVIFLVNLWFERKKDMHLLWKILFSAGASFVGCNLLNMVM